MHWFSVHAICECRPVLFGYQLSSKYVFLNDERNLVLEWTITLNSFKRAIILHFLYKKICLVKKRKGICYKLQRKSVTIFCENLKFLFQGPFIRYLGRLDFCGVVLLLPWKQKPNCSCICWELKENKNNLGDHSKCAFYVNIGHFIPATVEFLRIDFDCEHAKIH